MRLLPALLFVFLAFQACTQKPVVQKTKATSNSKEQTKPIIKKPMDIDREGLEVATLGAGCFWCIEAVFQELEGVYSVVSGYTGGDVENPTYKQISYENTGHVEVAQIGFDQTVISYQEILEVFWSTHDPTTKDRQGNDVGSQYRSAIFYHNKDQEAAARKSLAEVGQPLWDNTVVTEITALDVFYKAEDYHQNYYSLNPDQGYCRAVINPKLQKFRKKFSHKLKKVNE